MDMNKLPEMCYALDVIEKKAIIIKKGEVGYYQTNWPAGYTQEMIDELNKRLGVTENLAESPRL